jgi:hypothetical protein
MSDKFSSIWLELGHKNQKKILVCNLYREWRYMKQNNDEPKSVPAQLERWVIFLDQWEQALVEGKEVVVVGDVNLDFLLWGKDVSSNSHAHRLHDLSELLFSRIFLME